jgi:hypothetical protein
MKIRRIWAIVKAAHLDKYTSALSLWSSGQRAMTKARSTATAAEIRVHRVSEGRELEEFGDDEVYSEEYKDRVEPLPRRMRVDQAREARDRKGHTHAGRLRIGQTTSYGAVPPANAIALTGA